MVLNWKSRPRKYFFKKSLTFDQWKQKKTVEGKKGLLLTHYQIDNSKNPPLTYVASWIRAHKDIHALDPWDLWGAAYVAEDFSRHDWVKGLETGRPPGSFRRVQCNHRCPHKDSRRTRRGVGVGDSRPRGGVTWGRDSQGMRGPLDPERPRQWRRQASRQNRPSENRMSVPRDLLQTLTPRTLR